MKANEAPQQYILKSAVVVEIEKLKRKIDDHDDYANGWHNALSSVETGINFLEVKEVDLNEEIEKCLKRHSMLAVGKKDFTDIAKHFYSLGLAQKGE